MKFRDMLTEKTHSVEIKKLTSDKAEQKDLSDYESAYTDNGKLIVTDQSGFEYEYDVDAILTESFNKSRCMKVAKEFLKAAQAVKKLEDEFIKMDTGAMDFIPDDIGDIDQILDVANFLVDYLDEDEFYAELNK